MTFFFLSEGAIQMFVVGRADFANPVWKISMGDGM